MTFKFVKAERQAASVLIGLAGASGSGKTYSALTLARGLAGPTGRVAVIDTEAGRALHYADEFQFDHGDLRAPFTPDAYREAIVAADEAGYDVIVVDSMSHEHAGDGGLLDMHESELDRMAGTDYGKRERVKMAAWIKPKTQHKRLMNRLVQLRAHLILCFRAEPKVEMVREGGRTQIKPKESVNGANGWIPICEKSVPFELTMSLLMTVEQPGMPVPIKLQQQHRAMVPLDRAVSSQTGEAIREWAGGGSAPNPSEDVYQDALRAAESGKAGLTQWWNGTGKEALPDGSVKREAIRDRLPSLSAHAEAADAANGPLDEDLPDEPPRQDPAPRESGSAPLTAGVIWELHMPDGVATFSDTVDACEHIANMIDGGLTIASFDGANPGVLDQLAAADPKHFEWIRKVADRVGEAMR